MRYDWFNVGEIGHFDLKPIENVSLCEARFPWEGVWNAAKIICIVFLAALAVCFLILLSLFVASFIGCNIDSVCAGMDPANGLGRFFDASQLQVLAEKEVVATYDADTIA